jgi:hypothetical protein
MRSSVVVSPMRRSASRGSPVMEAGYPGRVQIAAGECPHGSADGNPAILGVCSRRRAHFRAPKEGGVS